VRSNHFRVDPEHIPFKIVHYHVHIYRCERGVYRIVQLGIEGVAPRGAT
jgi:hypothetical protein